jgi:hypothetical protein
MGSLTASAQLRSGGFQGSGNIDELCAFGNDEGWQAAVVDYAENYAVKVRKYYRQFLRDFKRNTFAV